MLSALKYLASFLLLFFTVNAVAASRVQCGAMKSKYVPGRIGYCAMLPPSYDASPGKRFPVLYFLHGLGGDQSFLASSGASSAIEEAWEEKRLGQFVIITPQGENSFYINSRDGHILYEDFFVREFVPQMERRFRLAGNRDGRAIAGVSMGGYGALRFAFKYPRMFVSVSAHMPALLEELPHGSSGAGLALFLGNAFGSPLNERFW
jgi:S-formylglutathione hydrolase FrmB